MANNYNANHRAVKRILREIKEFKDESSDEYSAAPLEDNLFEWHFTIRGPPDSEYEGGIYHGRIILPYEYPLKPPDIILLTPSGRFVVNQKICLSISGYHPEHWQPAWSIRTALVAIRTFMATPGKGAVGSLESSKENRRKLAKRSLEWSCSVCKSNNATVFSSTTPSTNSSTNENNQPIESSLDQSTENITHTEENKENHIAETNQIPENNQINVNEVNTNNRGLQESDNQPAIVPQVMNEQPAAPGNANLQFQQQIHQLHQQIINPLQQLQQQQINHINNPNVGGPVNPLLNRTQVQFPKLKLDIFISVVFLILAFLLYRKF